MAVNPAIWGPQLWYIMFIFAMNFPKDANEKLKKEYYNFFNSIKHLIPCSACRKSYTEYFKKYPIKKHFIDNLHLTHWVYLVKEEVNEKLKKQGNVVLPSPEFKQVYKMYKDLLNTKEVDGYLPAPKVPGNNKQHLFQEFVFETSKKSKSSSKSATKKLVKSKSNTSSNKSQSASHKSYNSADYDE
jgi:hypothetical protein